MPIHTFPEPTLQDTIRTYIRKAHKHVYGDDYNKESFKKSFIYHYKNFEEIFESKDIRTLCLTVNLDNDLVHDCLFSTYKTSNDFLNISLSMYEDTLTSVLGALDNLNRKKPKWFEGVFLYSRVGRLSEYKCSQIIKEIYNNSYDNVVNDDELLILFNDWYYDTSLSEIRINKTGIPS